MEPSLHNDPTAHLRHTVYGLFITIAFGMMVGHIVGVERSGPSPIHGDNDRSRWATIRSLVEKHSYTIGMRAYFDEAGTIFADEGQIIELRVHQEDMGKVIGRNGKTAKAIRSLLMSASTKANTRAVLQILE